MLAEQLAPAFYHQGKHYVALGHLGLFFLMRNEAIETLVEKSTILIMEKKMHFIQWALHYPLVTV
ncbi:hypothetical protein AAAC51_11310 [Priestia megaterium]